MTPKEAMDLLLERNDLDPIELALKELYYRGRTKNIYLACNAALEYSNMQERLVKYSGYLSPEDWEEVSKYMS